MKEQKGVQDRKDSRRLKSVGVKDWTQGKRQTQNGSLVGNPSHQGKICTCAFEKRVEYNNDTDGKMYELGQIPTLAFTYCLLVCLPLTFY